MRVLVTGASGFSGSYVAAALAQKGFDVTGLYRSALGFAASHEGLRGLTLIHTDLARVADLTGPFEAIVHTAATSPGSGITEADIERAVITVKGGKLRFHLPGSEAADAAARAAPNDAGNSDILTDEAIREIERSNLLAALERSDGKIYGAGGAAQLLGLKPTTVASRIQRLGIKRPVQS